MKHRFVHEFEDDPPLGDFDIELDAPKGAHILFDLNGRAIWVSANRAGWLHLARICAEMALHSQNKPGYHSHRMNDWKDSVGPEHEVPFELSDDGQTA
jgi:hypothetical protein